MLNDILNNLTNFLSIDRALFDNVLSIIIYLYLVYLAVKNGTSWQTILVAYIVISIVLTFLGISSYINLVEQVTKLIKSVFNDLFSTITDFIKDLFTFKKPSWWPW